MADAPKNTPSLPNDLDDRASSLSSSSSDFSPESSGLEVFCPKCIYNLRGIESERCPECGYSLAFLKIAESQIPWVHRKLIGRFRAYWRTVWWATFRRLKFGEELARPMSVRDARRFHSVTLCHFYLAIVLLTILLGILGPRNLQRAFQNHTTLALCATLVIHFCMLLFFAVVTRIGGDTIRNKSMPAGRQAHSVGLGYYAAGAFAWLPLSWLFMFVAFQQMIFYERVWYVAVAFAILGFVFSMLPGLLWLYDLMYIERCVQHRSSAEQAMAGLKQLLLLSTVGFVLLFMLPMAIAYIALIFYSLV